MGARTGNPVWKDHPDTSTLITAARLNAIEDAIDATVATVNGAGPDSAGNVVVSGGGGTVTATDAPAAPAEGASASYLVTSAVVWPAGLVWSTDPDGGTEPTITDAALVSLFTVDGTTYAVLGSTYPAPSAPDETGPTAGTLGVVVTSTTADGTVTGATDETELHATPYSFRIDAGTWSAWQAGATYEWTGLTASTEYDFQHRVRDAAGNITEGTVVTDTTDAPSGDTTDPTPGTLASSSITDTGFTLTVSGASDETALHATPYAFSTDNGATWSAWQAGATFNATELDPETTYTCLHRVRDAALNEATGASITVDTTATPSGDLEITYNGADTTLAWNAATYTTTHTAVPFGAPSAAREVIVGVSYRATSGSSEIVSATIGGVAATIDTTSVGANPVAILRAAVPTGTSGDVLVTFSTSTGTPTRCKYGSWSTNRAASVDASASAAAASLDLTDTTTGAIVVACSFAQTLGATATWTGVTADFDTDLSGGRGTSAGGTHTVTASWTTGTVFRSSAVAYT